MLDYIIRGGDVIDGTGSPARKADVGISGGRIVSIGKVDDQAAKVLDADGLIVAPGFVDPHTHYDAQLCWDGTASPSSNHGVTSIIGGNCGFTLAPVKQADADYTRRMMAQVEGMPLAALENGIDWSWETFGEYLRRLDGVIAVNAGFLVGHCALRRYVMGETSLEREATGPELERMVQVLRESLASGGLGLSTTRSHTHPDHNGKPVASRVASEDELLTLCSVVGEYPGTVLEAILSGCISKFNDDEVELMAQMSARAARPLNWNVLSVAASDPSRIEHQLRPSVRAREVGGRIVALTMPVFADNNMSFGTYCALWLIPGWRDILSIPLAEKKAKLADPAVRAEMASLAAASPFAGLANFARYLIGDTIDPANRQYEGRVVADIAKEKGIDPFQCIVEITAADDFRTVLWPLPAADAPEDWALRRDLWANSDVLIGGSDAGAHLDRILGSPYPTKFIGDSLRGRKLVTVERAVQLMTDVPARLFGLRERGRLAEGWKADVTVFDPATIDAGPARRVYDLPGDSLRLIAESIGVKRVLVNGVEIIDDGKATGATPGTVLRSGQETDTVATR